MSLLPAYILRELNNDGKLLSGGKIYFYISGTNVPKNTYTDATLTIPHTNPVVLDAGGAADIWLGSGPYRVLVTDMNGVQVRSPIDGIQGTAGGTTAESNLSVAFVKTYDEVRAMVSTPDVVYVSGRTLEGDGGQGLFQLLPLSSLLDDDGIILTSSGGANVYKRVFDAAIDPQWYGVKYGVSIDQYIYLNQALQGSVQFNFPVLLTSNTYLNQNLVVPSGATLNCLKDGYLHSGSSITITFNAGSRFSAISTAFGTGVRPIFAAGVVDYIRLSWMGENDTTKWTKILASSVAEYTINADITTTLTSDLTIPSNFSLDFSGASKVIFNAFANLTVPKLAYNDKSQIFQFNSINYVGTVALGADKSYIEWFGGLSGGDANTNAIAFKAIAMNGYWDLLVNSNYTITNTTGYTSNHELRINGNGSQFTLNQHVNLGGAGIGGLWMTDVKYNYSATGSITCVSFVAKDSYVYGDINCNTNLIYDSQVTNLDNISLAINSKFFNYTGHISGNVSGCEIYAYGMLPVDNQITIQNSKIQKTDLTESQKLPLFDTTHNIEMLQCTIDTNGILVYSVDAGLTITLTGCYSPNNFANALSNGYAKIVLNGCGVVNNSTAYSIDGITNENLINIKVAVQPTTITGSITNWKGVGSISTDGTSITTGVGVTLSNDPWNASTIRYMGAVDNTDTLMQTMFRYGGSIKTTVEYPLGQSPDPATKLMVAFVVPPIGSDPGTSTAGYTYNNMPVTMGVNIGCALPIVNGAKEIINTNAWGGQLDMLCYTGGVYPFNTPVGDIWGDWTQNLSAAGSFDTLLLIKRVPRIVIYNAGTGTIPAGTKFTIVCTPSLPNRDQYKRFWPAKSFVQYVTSTFYYDLGGYYGVNVRTSMYASASQCYQLDAYYMFRDCDINGLQTAVCRTPVGTPTKLAMDLPVASWWNGNTLNGSYS